MTAIVALDLGTTGVRALVVTEAGTVAARAYRPLTSAYPHVGWVEQDPAEMWERSVEVMRESLQASGVAASDVSAIGVVTQRATVLAWDADTGAPLAPAISWQDVRTAERVAELRAQGVPITTLASASKLAWWMEHDPSLRDAASSGRLRFGTPDSWLSYKLTGGAVHVTDPGQASCTMLFDPNEVAFAPAFCDLFGVPIEPLPQLVPTSAVVGETPARLLGVPIPVAARAGDQQAATFGQGAHAKGDAKLTLGTSAMLDVHTANEIVTPPEAAFPLALWQLGDADVEFCLEGQVLTAGAALDWLASLGVAADAAEVERLARSVASAEGVVFAPALQGLGTPYGDAGARGVLLGLSRGSSRAHLARAVIEGVAQRCAEVITALGVDATPLRVDGGLARSDLLLETIASLSGSELLRAREVETTGLGAAQLAGLAVGTFADPAACRATLPEPERFAPSAGPAEREAARGRWQAALRAARSAS